jgi:hypothetical protein
LGNSVDSINSSVTHVELERLQCVAGNDKISEVFDKEEKEEMENEEIDKLILNSLCSEIMDEVMYLGNAYPSDGKVTPGQKPSSSRKKGKKKGSNKKQKGSR